VDRATLSTLALIAAVAVIAPVLADLLRRFRIPGVVIEIGLGILIGPQVLKWAHVDDVVSAFSALGLSFLMFLAGYEIDLLRIKGRPLNRAVCGFALSVVLAGAFSFVMVSTGFALNTLVIGLALTTTALGTLLPMVRDADVLNTPFGSYVLAIGTVGEFGPIVMIALLLTGDNPFGSAVLLIVFIVVAVAAALLATRPQPPRFVRMMQTNLHSSSQLPVRVSVLLIVVLVWIASALGLDVLLGAFASGVVVRLFSAGPDGEVVREKLDAIGFGFLVPIFFIVSGMNFDLHALTSSPSTFLRLPLFLLLFLVVRGVPALVLYRGQLDRAQRLPLAMFSATALPLVVVITEIGVASGRMRPENAAALVGAGMLSVLIYPLVGFALLRRAGVVAGPLPPESKVSIDFDTDDLALDPPEDSPGSAAAGEASDPT
jgi:Kef-type K+ transport system membrane component KefB